MTLSYEQVIQTIQQLPASEQKKVLEWLEQHKPIIEEKVSEAEQLEQKFLERLFAKWLINEIPPRLDDDDDDFEPIEIEGEPLSEMIIRERR